MGLLDWFKKRHDPLEAPSKEADQKPVPQADLVADRLEPALKLKPPAERESKPAAGLHKSPSDSVSRELLLESPGRAGVAEKSPIPGREKPAKPRHPAPARRPSRAAQLLQKLEEHGGRILSDGVLQVTDRETERSLEYWIDGRGAVCSRTIRPEQSDWSLHVLNPESRKPKPYDPVWEYFRRNGVLSPFMEAIILAARRGVPKRDASGFNKGGVTPAELAAVVGCSRQAAADYLRKLFPRQGAESAEESVYRGKQPRSRISSPGQPAERPPVHRRQPARSARDPKQSLDPAAVIRSIWSEEEVPETLTQRAILSVLWLYAKQQGEMWACRISVNELSRKVRCSREDAAAALSDLGSFGYLIPGGPDLYQLTIVYPEEITARARAKEEAAKKEAAARRRAEEARQRAAEEEERRRAEAERTRIKEQVCEILMRAKEVLSQDEIAEELGQQGGEQLLSILEDLIEDGVVLRYEERRGSGTCSYYEINRSEYAVAQLKRLLG